MAPPKNARAALVGQDGGDKFGKQSGASEITIAENLRDRQAARLRKRFALSWALASAAADIAFQNGRAA